MRYLARSGEPDSWTEFIKRNKRKRYAELQSTAEGKKVRQELRKNLVTAQHGLCAYCCGHITPDAGHSLNEHIKPESRFPNETMNYSNLVASCVNTDSCGHAKGDQYTTAFVSPLEPDCAKHFKFYPDGSVEGADRRGEETLELLQLNCYRLRDARRAMLESLSWADEEYVRNYCLTPNESGQLQQFADMLEQMCEDGFFSRENSAFG